MHISKHSLSSCAQVEHPKNCTHARLLGLCSFPAVSDTLRACCLPETWWPFLRLSLQNRDTNSLLPGTANRTPKCFREHVLAGQGACSASHFKGLLANENEPTIASTLRARAYALTEKTTDTDWMETPLRSSMLSFESCDASLSPISPQGVDHHTAPRDRFMVPRRRSSAASSRHTDSTKNCMACSLMLCFRGCLIEMSAGCSAAV